MLRMLGYFAAWALIAGGYSVGITLVVVAAKSITLTIPLGAGVALFGVFLMGITSTFLGGDRSRSPFR
jgi:hypothetical protein